MNIIETIKKLFQNFFAIRLGKLSDYLYAFFGAMAIILYHNLAIQFFDSITKAPELPENLQPFFEVATGEHDYLFYYIIISVCLVAPITEELFFRGALWHILEKFLSKKYVFIITSILFALAHVEPYHIIGVLPVGVYIGWLRLRSNSIFPPILAHMTNNLIVCLYLINW